MDAGMSIDKAISEDIPVADIFDSKYDMGELKRIAQALDHDGSVMIRMNDGRIVKVTAIIYDGNDWYATSGMGTYDQHGLRWYETGVVIRTDNIATVYPDTQK